MTQGQLRKKSGGCDRDRTCDPLIKSQLLYQLSYAPTPPCQCWPDEALYRHWPLRCPALRAKNRRHLIRPTKAGLVSRNAKANPILNLAERSCLPQISLPLLKD